MTPSKSRRRVGTLVVLLGLALLLWVGLQVVERRAAQRALREELTETLPPFEAPELQGTAESEVVELEVLAPRPAPGALVARIRIAEAGVDAVALEGVDLPLLERAVGHFPGTALPGEQGNASFAAHRDSFFRGLRHVEVGAEVEVETPDAVHTYRIEEMRVVEPTEVDVVEPRGGRQLTLITCYPFDYVGAAPRRFVVHARWLGTRGRQPDPDGGLAD